MSLRITQSHLYARARSDIQNGLFRYARLQREVATGRHINQPSDDPTAALRIIPLQNDLRNLRQLGDNVKLARETLDTGAAGLEDASALMQRVRELTMQAANGTVSDGDRTSIGAEVSQLLSQLVGIANSKRGDRFLFGGTASDEAPFRLIRDAGGTRVEYAGNHDSLDVEVAPGVTTALNVPGDAIFQARDRGATTFFRSGGAVATGAQPTGIGDTGIGFDQLEIGFAGLHSDTPPGITAGAGATNALGPLGYTFTASPATLSVGGGPALAIPVTDGAFVTADGRTISLSVSGVPATLTGTFTAKAGLSVDGGASVTEVSDFGQRAVLVADSRAGTGLNVDVRTLARTGTEQVKFAGTFDAFTTLITLRDLLTNEAGLPEDEVRDRISQMLGEVDSAHDAVLDGVRELGFRSSSMTMLDNRVAGLTAARTESLSAVQDTDIAEAILEMRRHELGYEAALQVSARIVQTTLQGFLR